MIIKPAKFFLEHSRINHLAFVFLILVGIYASFKVSKEIFPSFELDMIVVSGGYSGSSIDLIDKAIVNSIEDNIKNIDGISSVSSTIEPGKFKTIIKLKNHVDKNEILTKVKDGVSLAKNTFPSDMNDPYISIASISKDLIVVAILSQSLSTQELAIKAEKMQDKLLSIKGVSEVGLNINNKIIYEIVVNEEKLKALGISYNSFLNVLSKLSYVFPVGKIEDSIKQYISTSNGKKTKEDFENTILNLKNKIFYLSDVAKIEKRLPKQATLSTVNKKPSINLTIKQSENSNAISISEDIRHLIKQEQKNEKNLTYNVYRDNSILITQRLNIVISSILLGIILLFIAMSFLINLRMAIIITMGIPTAFLFTIICFWIFGFSINLVSLIGLMIATGIIVDDAIVISENIQRYIEEGMESSEAAYKGLMELIKPITIASITTVFAFLPALMISGTLGKFIALIPIAVSISIVASLVEVFLFLPLHSKHILSKNSKSLSWNKVNILYMNGLRFIMKYKKSFIFSFIILVPLMGMIIIKMSSFQMFPRFDSNKIILSLKANKNIQIEDSFKIIKEVEISILKNREKWGILNTSTTAGYRITNARGIERNSYSMHLEIELYNLIPSDPINKYIIPNLSFFHNGELRKREITSREISKQISEFIKSEKYKEKYNLESINVVQSRAGPITSDIQIGLQSNDDTKIIKALNEIQKMISNSKGVTSSFISANLGIREIKMQINTYGESLGLTEADLGKFLSNYYLSKKVGTVLEQNAIVDVKIHSINKDNLDFLQSQHIPLNNGTFVNLEDVVSFNTIQSFEKVIKDNGKKIYYIYANVNPDIATASELLKTYQEKLQEIRERGIKVILKGEDEKKKDLARDMKIAFAMSMILILISMLYMFNSFKQTFIVLSVIPFSFFGVLLGHSIIGINLSMLSFIGALGLSGVVINDGIIMMDFLKKANSLDEIFQKAALRLRPIMITSITTLIGLSVLIFFPYGQAVIFRPISVSLGFGLFWGTILNLVYVPVLYVLVHKRFDK